MNSFVPEWRGWVARAAAARHLERVVGRAHANACWARLTSAAFRPAGPRRRRRDVLRGDVDEIEVDPGTRDLARQVGEDAGRSSTSSMTTSRSRLTASWEIASACRRPRRAERGCELDLVGRSDPRRGRRFTPRRCRGRDAAQRAWLVLDLDDEVERNDCPLPRLLSLRLSQIIGSRGVARAVGRLRTLGENGTRRRARNHARFDFTRRRRRSGRDGYDRLAARHRFADTPLAPPAGLASS